MDDKQRVFVLDDNQELWNIYRRIFDKEFDLVCDCYANINEALLAIEKYGVDYWRLFICDLRMPGEVTDNDVCDVLCERLNGLWFIHKYLPPHKVVVVTGYATPETMEMVKNLKVATMFGKPFSVQMFIINIGFILSQL